MRGLGGVGSTAGAFVLLSIPTKTAVRMVRRKCLDCPRLIASGSRCAACAAAYKVPKAWSVAVKRRDGYRCVICGSADRVQADHIVARSRGGSHEVSNGQTLCNRHHAEKHGAKV